MNQMTTKVLKGGGGARLAPALGESWAHATQHRVQLEWQVCVFPVLLAVQFLQKSVPYQRRHSDAIPAQQSRAVRFFLQGPVRVARMLKSSEFPSGSALYAVTPRGVRSVQDSQTL
jgi:hypothetical protein